MVKKNRLGKGLGALLSEGDNSNDENKITNIFIENIEPNPFQPRKEFDQETLEELADSIKNNGVLQPITVRKIKPELYQLVTGERRWRASKLVGINKIPSIIKDYSDHQMMEIALIENLQREDLNSIEEAHAYKRMMEEFNMNQEEVAQKVGKSRSNIANMLRLLHLVPKVQMFVSRETLSMGHARALVSIKDNEKQIKAAEYVIKNNLTVRDTEKYVSRIKNLTANKEEKEQKSNNDENKLDKKWIKAQEKLSSFLGTKVKINSKKNKKVFSIECKDYNDVEKLLDKLY
jgi:ParB family chromosome partitioning protein